MSRRNPSPPARWGMLALCFAATAVNYIDRANLSVAASAMKHQYGLGDATMGLILGAFFWTYAIMQLPAGWLIDRFGPKLVYACAVSWWSVFTMATAVARGAASLCGCRLLLGIGESAAYPADAKVVGLWFPTEERALASAIFDSGARVGTACAFPIVSALIAGFGWRTSFAVTGLIGFLWVAAWVLVYRNPRPDEAPLHAPPAADPKHSPGAAIRWRDLFRYRTIWGMMAGFFCLNFIIYFYVTWFPTYMIEARGFSMPRVGSLGAVPALCAIPGGWLGGWVSDHLYRRGWSLTRARKTCLVGGMLVSSTIALTAWVHSTGIAMLCLSVSFASLTFTGANVWSLPCDVAPTRAHVASIGGIQNFAANVAGIVTSFCTGILLKFSHGSFAAPLTLSGGIAIVGAACFLWLVGEVKPLPPIQRRTESSTQAAP